MQVVPLAAAKACWKSASLFHWKNKGGKEFKETSIKTFLNCMWHTSRLSQISFHLGVRNHGEILIPSKWKIQCYHVLDHLGHSETLPEMPPEVPSACILSDVHFHVYWLVYYLKTGPVLPSHFHSSEWMCCLELQEEATSNTTQRFLHGWALLRHPHSGAINHTSSAGPSLLGHESPLRKTE